MPDLLIAFACLTTWLFPSLYGSRWVHRSGSLMVQEFIVIHSSVFLAWVIAMNIGRGKKVIALICMSSVYSMFSFGFGSWPALISFWLLWINRSMPTLAGQALSENAMQAAVLNWVASLVIYLFAVFLTTYAPVPAMGITADVIQGQGFAERGLWVEQPYRVLAAGVIYYAGIGLWQLHAGYRVWKQLPIKLSA
ncbi:MAG: hypothetical protein HZB31_13285 [Nitrospirae bacterium]|nr:hypothetical protein [Nitrospirota bacterium]